MPRQNSLVYGKNTPTITPVRGRNTAFAVFLLFLISSTNLVGAVGLVGEEFIAGDKLVIGSIVSIDKDNPESIELSHIDNSEYLLGVVVDGAENSVTFSKENSQTTVALSGEVDVFVNDANGEVKAGDFVGASWLEGVGMKSLDANKQKLLGIAVEDYDSKSAKIYGEIDTTEGSKTVSIDAVKIRLFDKEGFAETVDSRGGLEELLSNVAGKQISYAKVLASSILFIVTLLVSGMFIVSSIRGSFISIGRNPMASATIYKSLLHVSGLSVLVLIVGTALTYVVLVI